jgi:hypothetical protein
MYLHCYAGKHGDCEAQGTVLIQMTFRFRSVGEVPSSSMFPSVRCRGSTILFWTAARDLPSIQT